MRSTITLVWNLIRPHDSVFAGIVTASRHIITNPGSMSDIVISKCLRAHYLYE